jgi:type II secretory pathway component PulJ
VSVRHTLVSGASGHTLLELMIATTLISLFAILIGVVSSAYFGLLTDMQKRTENVREANIVRARMIGDAKRAASAVCSSTTTVLFTIGEGGLETQVEYATSGGSLLRWVSAPERQVRLVEGITALACTDGGDEGLEVDLDMGTSREPYHLYLHFSTKPPDDEGGEES